jgi:hypothetical protein
MSDVDSPNESVTIQHLPGTTWPSSPAHAGTAPPAAAASRRAWSRTSGGTTTASACRAPAGPARRRAATASRMTESSTKTYVSRILAKLGCANRVKAALLARDAGLSGGTCQGPTLGSAG